MSISRIPWTAAAVLIFASSSAFAEGPVRGFSAEVMQYQTGTIITAARRQPLTPQVEWELRAGVNLAYHDNQGVRDEENGIGWGVGTGLRWYPERVGRPIYAGIRVDLWRMKIDWKNRTDTNLASSGVSRFVIVQPMAELGWDFWRVPGKFLVGATLGAGWEINTFVRGAKTGQGPIAVAGLSLTLL